MIAYKRRVTDLILSGMSLLISFEGIMAHVFLIVAINIKINLRNTIIKEG